MKWGQSLKLSVLALWRSRLRTLLSAGGMAIGIAAVSLLFALGEGAERNLQASIERMGRNLLTVSPDLRETNSNRASSQYQTLKLGDSDDIHQRVADAEKIAPVLGGELALRWGRRRLVSPVIGTTADFQQARNLNLASGRFIDDTDVTGTRRVAVIGAQVANQLYFGEWPLGRRLYVRDTPFTVIGVLQEKGASTDGSNEDNQIIIPVTTAQRRVFNVDFLSRILVQVSSRSQMGHAKNQIDRLLRSRHRIGEPGQTADFKIQDEARILAIQARSDSTFSRLIMGLAALTLGLGGIGLLATSLLSVGERYGEIGLRLAVGAKPSDILLQFLAEAVLIAATGGILGLFLGTIGVALTTRLTSWSLALSWETFVYPFVISLGIAAIFGAYPALRAARLDPIFALRTSK